MARAGSGPLLAKAYGNEAGRRPMVASTASTFERPVCRVVEAWQPKALERVTFGLSFRDKIFSSDRMCTCVFFVSFECMSFKCMNEERERTSPAHG